MTKLSIVIPVYNVEKYLAKCLDSIIYPQIPDYEIIIINDGSTDSSPEIAEKYAQKYPSLIKLVSTPNGGLGHARTEGLAIASGEYIQFIDSDDYLAENAVPEILESLKLGYDMAIFDFVPVTESGRRLSYETGCKRDGMFSLEEYPELLFEYLSAWNKIYKKSLFTDNSITYPDRIWFEDFYTTPKLYAAAEKITHIGKPWYNYLQRPGSILRNKNLARNLEIIQVCDEVLGYYKSHGLYEKYSRQLEYTVLYNELITSTTRVNLGDKKSPVQAELLDYFLRNFPDYKSNPYINSMAPKLKLLMHLITHKHYGSVNLIMKLNNRIKKKNS